MLKRCLSGLLLVPVLLSGTEFFCSPSGSDAAAGTRNAPWKTVSAAVNKARSGDVVILLPGEYQETIEMKSGGVTLRGTRGKSGEYLSLIAPAETLTGWTAEPAIADGMWSVPLKAAPGCVTVNGRQIILIGQRMMKLAPKQMRVEKLSGKHYAYGKGGVKERTREMIPGLDLLALPKDVRIVSDSQIGKGVALELWSLAGGMMAGWRNGRLYLRIIDGRKPDGFVVRAGGSSAILIRDQSDIIIDGLKIGTCRSGIVIRGKAAKNNTVRRCRIEHGVNRITVTDGASGTRILDNILSLGYIRPELFSSTLWKYNRAMYLIYKYLVSNRQISDDDALSFFRAGSGNLAEGNIIFQGLNGTETSYCAGVVIRSNVIREMSSCGIVLDKGSNQEVCGNVLINNGINVRNHSFHEVPQGRTCFVHDNILYYSAGWGMQLFTLCGSRYPESPENVWFYHNTIVGSFYFMNERAFARTYKGKPQPIYIVNNLLFLDLKHPASRFSVPELRMVAGNADAGACANLKKWGERNSFHVGIEGKQPFLKVKSTPELLAKSVNLQKSEGIVPVLPGMKDHSPLPGAQWDPKMVELVQLSDRLAEQAVNAMKSK